MSRGGNSQGQGSGAGKGPGDNSDKGAGKGPGDSGSSGGTGPGRQDHNTRPQKRARIVVYGAWALSALVVLALSRWGIR